MCTTGRGVPLAITYEPMQIDDGSTEKFVTPEKLTFYEPVILEVVDTPNSDKLIFTSPGSKVLLPQLN